MRLAPIACALVFCSAIPAVADENAITYDLRIFEVTAPLTNVLPGDYLHALHENKAAIVSLAANALTPETGFPLNANGDILYWDREGKPENPNISLISTHNQISVPLTQEATLSNTRDIPTQYLEPRPGGRYDLKMVQYESGIRIRLKPANGGVTDVSCCDSRAIQREEIPEVTLDVGKPKEPVFTKLRAQTPNGVWGDCVLFGDGEQSTVVVFVRMHADAATVENTDAAPIEQYSIELKVLSAPPKTASTLAEIIVPKPDIKPIAGAAQAIEGFVVNGKEIGLDDPARLSDLISSYKDVSLVSAPRVTVFSEGSSRKPARSVENDVTNPAKPVFQFDDCPIIEDFLRLRRAHMAVVCDIASYPENKLAYALTKKSLPHAIGAWHGVVAGVSVNPGLTPDTAALDLALVVRQQLGLDDFHNTGFRFKIEAPLGKSMWFTTMNERTNERLIVQCTVKQVPYQPNRFYEAPDDSRGVGGFLP